ncbi:MAG: beta strand repeat-containing protein [Planctomycetaceae bacterium]
MGTATTTLAGPLVSGSSVGGFTKAGPGLTTLTSTSNSYAGATRIEGGMLAASGRLYAGSVGTASAVTVASGTLFASNFSDLPTGSLGNLPAAADRITLDGGAVRLAGSGSTGRGFTIGAGGGLVELQPGVNVLFLETTPAARVVSLGGDLTLHATTGSGTLAKAYMGTGGLIKTGSGTWTLAGANTYSGTTRVVAGTLRIAGTSSLVGSTLDLNPADAGGVVFVAGTASTFELGGLSGSRALAIGSHSLRIGGNGGSTSFTGSIAGAGGIEKTGPGTLTLGGSNAFAGGVTVAEGMLRFTQAAALPASATMRIGADGTLALPAGSPLGDWIAAGRIDAASSGAIAISGSLGAALDLSRVPGLSLGGSGSANFSGTIVADPSGVRLGGGDGTLTVTANLAANRLIKTGADTVTLTGSNAFAQGIDLRGGLVQPASPAAFGTTGTITFAGGGLRFSSGDATDYSPRFSQAPGQHFRIDTAGRTVAFSQPLSSAGGSLTKLGEGTLSLAATNALDGTVRIAAGTLSIAGTTALAAATLDLAAGDSGTLAFTAPTPRTYAFAGLTGSRNLAIAGHTLEIGGTGRSTSYAGVISGSGGLIKVGGGTLTLAGDSTFTGTTTVAAGTLRIGVGGTTGSVRGPLVNQASVVFDRSGTSSHATAISGSGGIVKAGSGAVILTGTSTFTGGIRVEAGTLQLGGVVSPTGRLTMAGGTFAFARTAGSQAVAGVTVEAGDAAMSNTVASGTLALGAIARESGGVIRFPTRTGPITTSATAVSGILGAWAFAGSGTGTRYATVAGGTIAAYTSGTVLSGTTAFGGIPSGDTGTVNYDVTSAGTFAAMGLTRVVNTIDYSGSGAVQPAANAVTLTTNGILTSGGGRLVIGGSPRMDIVAGASRELVVNTATADVVLNNGVFNHASGVSGLTKAGTATLVINGSSGYTGRTTVAAGTLRFGSGGSGLVVASSELVVRGTLAFDHADAVTVSGGLAGDGAVVKDGGGMLTLTGTGGFTGRIAVAGGTLAVGGGAIGPGGVFAGGLDVAAGGAYVHRSTGSQTFAAPVSGDGSLAVNGGRLVLAAANTFTADVTVGSGATLVLAHPDALGGQPAGGGITIGTSTSSVLELAADGGSPLLRGGDGFSTKLVVGAVAGSTASVARRDLAAGSTFGGGTLAVASSPALVGVAAELGVPVLALSSGSAGAVTRLAPTTARVSLGGAAIAAGSLPMTLELSGTAAGNVVLGVIADGAAPLSLAKSGAGEWTLAAPTTFTGATRVTGGTLRLADSGALSASGSLAIAGGRVALPADVPLALGLRGLSVDEASGMLDVGRGRVTVAAGLTRSAILADLVAGRGSGAWDGLAGITSSAVAADVAAGAARTIGWLDHGAGSFTVGYAAAGDTNLDAIVDVLDAANFLSSGLFDAGTVGGWSDGDFTADGLVDILDVADFVSTGLFDAGGYVAPAASAAPLAAVPEPAATALLAVALGAGLVVRRVSRRS